MDRGCGVAVATNLLVLSVEHPQRTKPQPHGAIGRFFSHDRPEADPAAVTFGQALAAEPDPTDLVSVVKKVCG